MHAGQILIFILSIVRYYNIVLHVWEHCGVVVRALDL